MHYRILLAASLLALSACAIDGDEPNANATDDHDDDDDENSSDDNDGSSSGAPDPDTGDSSDTGDTDVPEDSCPTPAGPGTDVPSTIDADQTWTAEGSPYRVTSTVYVTATVTLEPCTVVQLSATGRIEVGNEPAPGAIVSRGEAEPYRPVVFERLDPGAPWATISIDTTGELDAEVTEFRGGGSINGDATITAWGATPWGGTTPNVRVQQVVIADAEHYGVRLNGRAAFTADSTGLHVEGSGAEPILIEAGAVHSLPLDLTVADNAADVVLVDPFGNVDEDTFVDRDVPLRLIEAMYLGSIEGDGLATLTIEPGTEIEFASDSGGIYIGLSEDQLGELVAVGTADAPIVFRSAQPEPAPGDWMGLYFRYVPTSGNRLEHATIAHAGGVSGAQGWGCGPAENHASILMLTQAVDPFLVDCTFVDAGGDTQLLLGWSDDPDPSGTASAWAAGNTFADAPTCGVSLPRDENNGCPGDAAPDCL